MKENNIRVRSGFTLIEILVVVAIIALLAAILFPVFGRARENARRSTCQSNLKQLGLGMLQYMQDSDERVPQGLRETPAYSKGAGWAGQLLPYVKSTQVYKCPNEMGRPGVANGNPSTGAQYYSYRYNQGLRADQSNSFSSGGVTIPYNDDRFIKTLAAFTAPSMTVALYEVSGLPYTLDAAEDDSPSGNGDGTKNSAGGWAPCSTDTSLICSTMIQGTYTIGTARHFNGSNYLCMDGHVKWYPTDQVSFGFAARLAGNAEANSGGTNSHFAHGTEYQGADKKQITFSYR